MAKKKVSTTEVIQAGKHELHINTLPKRYGGQSVIRLKNGFALSLGATPKYKDIIIKEVIEGKYDEYIEKFSKLAEK